MTRTATTHASERATATRSPEQLLDPGRVEADLNFLLDGSVVATASDQDPAAPYGEFAVWDRHIGDPEMTIIWDTGSQPDAVDGYWPSPLFRAFAHDDATHRDLDMALEEHGYTFGDIDAVVMGHLHPDHAGGLHRLAVTEKAVYVHASELQSA